MTVKTSCQRCAVRQKALCSALSSTELNRIAHRRRAPSGKLILNGQQEPNWLAVIVSGVVKLVKTSPDGRQQIVALQFPGQFLGRPYGKHSPFQAEAATDLELCCFAKTSFEGLMREHPGLEHLVMQQTLDELDMAREWLFVLGCKTAAEKVASLLLVIAHRLRPLTCDETPDGLEVCVDLPLSRTEMAEYLGLTLETVSRQIGTLKSAGIIELDGTRTLRVPDLARLQARAERETA